MNKYKDKDGLRKGKKVRVAFGGGLRFDEYDTWVGAGEEYLVITNLTKDTANVTAQGSLATWKVLREQVELYDSED